MDKTLLGKHAANKWSKDLACEMLDLVTNHENGVSIDVQSAAAKIRRIVAIKSDERIEAMASFPTDDVLGVDKRSTEPMSALVDDMRIYLNRCIEEEKKNAENGIESAERAATALRFARRFMMERYERRLQGNGRVGLDEDVERHVRRTIY